MCLFSRCCHCIKQLASAQHASLLSKGAPAASRICAQLQLTGPPYALHTVASLGTCCCACLCLTANLQPLCPFLMWLSPCMSDTVRQDALSDLTTLQVKPILARLKTTLAGSTAALVLSAGLLIGLVQADADADGIYGRLLVCR